MMGLIKFLQKRPSDITIYSMRILFGLILITSLYYNLIIQGDSLETNYFWYFDASEEISNYIKYFFIGLGIIPILMGVSGLCLFKKKYMKIIQIIFGILLFYISSKIIANRLDVDSLIGFMGIFPLIAGITGKCITTKCLKFKEKITKIRV